MSLDRSAEPDGAGKPQTDAEWAALIERLQERVGASVRVDDHVAANPAERLAATLDQEPPPLADGAALPVGWHCLYCLPAQRLDALGVDGLPLSAEPIPEIPLSRRVFGGATLVFGEPLRFGDRIVCETRLTRLTFKASRSGPIVIATLERSYSTSRGIGVVETQDIVHLEGGDRAAAPPPPPPPFERHADWRQRVTPTMPLLFRFSALTFNSHRIHYDAPYTVEAEGQPALLVQGRLLAVLSLELARRQAEDRDIASFAYRSSLAVYANAPFEICAEATGEGLDTWVLDSGGRLAQTGKVVLRSRSEG